MPRRLLPGDVSADNVILVGTSGHPLDLEAIFSGTVGTAQVAQVYSVATPSALTEVELEIPVLAKTLVLKSRDHLPIRVAFDTGVGGPSPTVGYFLVDGNPLTLNPIYWTGSLFVAHLRGGSQAALEVIAFSNPL